MVTNRTAYTFVIIGILILVAVGVSAYNSGGPASEIGHTFNDEIQPPTGCNNLFIKVNSAGTGWECTSAGGVDTNAGTICDGTSVYLDGDGNCDTISGGSAWTVSGSNVYRSTGNVGIGTSSPVTKLDIYGTSDGDGIKIGDSSGFRIRDYDTNFGVNTLETWFMPTSGTGKMVLFGNSNSEMNLILYDGKLGIGTTNPTSALHVVGGVKIDGSSLSINAGGSQMDLNFNPADDVVEIVNHKSAGTTQIMQTGLGKIYLSTQSGLRNIVMDSEGDLGIGTTTPAEKLEVVGNIKASGSICANGGTNCVGALSCTRIETYFYTDSGFSDACPAGKIITGGGCICGSNGVVELTIPTTPLNQWYCMCNAAATNRAYGICC